MIKNSSGISVDFFFPLPFFDHFWMTFKIKPEERNKFPEVKQPSSPRPLSIAWIISLPAWWNLAKGHLLFLGSPLLFERLQTHTFLLVNLTCATEVEWKKKKKMPVWGETDTQTTTKNDAYFILMERAKSLRHRQPCTWHELSGKRGSERWCVVIHLGFFR